MSHTSRPSSSQSSQAHPSRSTPFFVALVVLLCIGAMVALALLLRGEDVGAATGSDGHAQSSGTPGDCGDAPEPVAQPEQFEQPPDPAEAESTTWEAVLATNCGDITLELFGDKAPQTVASFNFLA
ncbi:MAG: peptidylprolyl isomerase, partial [Nocardioidaceae bacterium]